MPFGVSGVIAGGLVDAGIGAATAGILADGIVGAGIGGGLSSLTGGSFGKGALMGGLGGAVFGGSGLLQNLAPETAASLGIGGAAGTTGAAGSNAAAGNVGTALGDAGTAAGAAPAAAGSAASGASGAGTGFSGLFDKLGNAAEKNPLQALLVAQAAAQAFNRPQVNVGQNAANVMSTNPSFSTALPKYTMQNTATPYAGDWYKYGQSPQAPLYNAQPIPVAQAHGGLIDGYAHGGTVKGYAMGGMPMAAGAPPMPPAAAPPAMGAPAAPRSPLATPQNGFAIGKAIGQHLLASGALKNVKSPGDAHKIGTAIGQHLSNATFTGHGQVPGQGSGQQDSVPAKLSVGEFVVPADVVAHLGDGTSDAGGKALTHLVKSVRAHKAVKGFPPKARNPLSYLPKGTV